mmetsp:Transcript_23749/g.70590  ORF Transcript_23749/g.70590 Transcript_23749/m.70590 type:complete len:254 (+) Transcript_23749:958-1719(+)
MARAELVTSITERGTSRACIACRGCCSRYVTIASSSAIGVMTCAPDSTKLYRSMTVLSSLSPDAIEDSNDARVGRTKPSKVSRISLGWKKLSFPRGSGSDWPGLPWKSAFEKPSEHRLLSTKKTVMVVVVAAGGAAVVAAGGAAGGTWQLRWRWKRRRRRWRRRRRRRLLQLRLRWLPAGPASDGIAVVSAAIRGLERLPAAWEMRQRRERRWRRRRRRWIGPLPARLLRARVNVVGAAVQRRRLNPAVGKRR